MSQPKMHIGKNWGRGKEVRTKKFTFKEKPKKTITEADELKKLKELCEQYDSSKVKTFRDIPLSGKTFSCLKDAGYTKPTEIQKESIGLALKGLDILGAAKTGSGKTLAFLIPVIEILNAKLWTNMDGLGALIITPTRELAYQIFETLRKIGRKHEFSAGLIIGGKDLKFERRRMDQLNIIICTPGRLLQHMDENASFDCNNVQVLVLDEADRCLDMGFQQSMNAIIANLPLERQTLLFSATQTKSVKDLARLSLKSPVYVSVHEHSQFSTPETLQQSYIVCPLELKLDMLWSFIKHHKRSKVLVFLSSCKQVRFLNMLFCRMRPGISILALYGTLHQLKRMTVYEEFCKKQAVVLFATDIAARGLDFPGVDWVLQLDCPEDATTYIHRAGRTARLNKNGESLLVLLPSEEEAMLEQLEVKKIPIKKIEVNNKKLVSVKRKFEALLARDLTLKECAQLAFKAYLKSSFLMKNKKVFDVTALDLPSFASSLGLAVAPRVRFLQKRQVEKSSKTKPKSEGVKSESDSEEIKIKEEPESDEEDEGTSNYEVLQSQQQKSDPTYDFSIEDEDQEDCDNLFVGKREIKLEDNAEADAAAQEFLRPTNFDGSTKSKNKSKAAVAKKLLKRNIKVNKIVAFDEEGEAVTNLRRERQTDLAKTYETEDASGIDIEKAKEILKLEDQVDKKLHRERIKAKHKEERRKAKLKRKGITEEDEENQKSQDAEVMLGDGQEVRLGYDEDQADDYSDEEDDDDDDGGTGPDLSWLPDPDKVYRSADEEDDYEAEDFNMPSDDDDKFSESQQEIQNNRSKSFPKNKNKRKAPIEDSDDEFAGQIVNTSDESDSDSNRNRPMPSKISLKLQSMAKSQSVSKTKANNSKETKKTKNKKKTKKQKLRGGDSDDSDNELGDLDPNLMEELALKLLK